MSVIPPSETLKYINEARTSPSKFAQYVKKELGTFINQFQMPLFPGCNYNTNEGKGAWTEAYNFLIKQPPIHSLILHDGLTLAAEDHAIDLAEHNIFGHNGSKGSNLSSRIAKRCQNLYGSLGQNIGSDFKVQGRNHALQTVLGLIIDDGVPDRGHRINLFSKDFKYVGISSRVQGDKIITVMDFHSQNLGLNNGQQNSNNAGSSLQYENKGKFNQGGFSFGNNDGWADNDGWGQMGNNWGGFGGQLSTGGGQISVQGHGQGGKVVVSQSTSIKTQTINGVTKTLKITKIKYSDGSQEEQREESIQ